MGSEAVLGSCVTKGVECPLKNHPHVPDSGQSTSPVQPETEHFLRKRGEHDLRNSVMWNVSELRFVLLRDSSCNRGDGTKSRGPAVRAWLSLTPLHLLVMLFIVYLVFILLVRLFCMCSTMFWRKESTLCFKNGNDSGLRK